MPPRKRKDHVSAAAPEQHSSDDKKLGPTASFLRPILLPLCLAGVVFLARAAVGLLLSSPTAAEPEEVEGPDFWNASGVDPNRMPIYSFVSSGRELPAGGREFLGQLPKPCAAGSEVFRSFSLLRGAVTTQAAELRAAANELSSGEFGTHPDEVDGQPAFELYLVSGGEPVESPERLGDAGGQLGTSLQGALNDVLMPYVRERYSCPECTACTAFLRRYLPGERRLNPTHFDMEAFVTIVIALSADAEYGGGLYVQATPEASSRKLVQMESGDALIHQYDFNHGVAVTGGSRYSLVIWISNSKEACAAETSPWYVANAEGGDADAQWNLGHLYKRGARGMEQDTKLALGWYEKSAAQGHPGAMNNLGLLLEDGNGQGGQAQADAWFRKSAELGEANSQLNLAVNLAASGELAEAARWYRRAARQGSPKAMVALGRTLEAGSGAPKDLGRAAAWYEQATESGHGPAFFALGKLHVGRRRMMDGLQWLMKGAAVDDVDCMVAIAGHYLDGQGVAKSRDKAEGWIERALSLDESHAAGRLLKARLT